MSFLKASEQHGLPRIASIQNAYNLVNRSYEIGLSEITYREQVSLLGYSPLGQGYLSGKYEGGALPPNSRKTLFDRLGRYEKANGPKAISTYVALARRHGLDPAQMAIAFAVVAAIRHKRHHRRDHSRPAQDGYRRPRPQARRSSRLRTSSRSILTIRTHALDCWARASALPMPRLFSAIEIPRPLAERLTLLRAGLTGARWIDPENYHLTLRFIGDVDGSTAREFAEALGGIEVPPFELRLNGLGSFGGHKPRAIFAGIAPSDGLDALRRANERAAREAGLPPEGRNFKPHVTLARLRNARADAVAAYLEHQGGIAAEPFTVSRFVLYSSRNSVGGGPYVVEAAYPLED